MLIAHATGTRADAAMTNTNRSASPGPANTPGNTLNTKTPEPTIKTPTVAAHRNHRICSRVLWSEAWNLRNSDHQPARAARMVATSPVTASV